MHLVLSNVNGFPLDLPIVEKFFAGVETAVDVQIRRLMWRRGKIFDAEIRSSTVIFQTRFEYDGTWLFPLPHMVINFNF